MPDTIKDTELNEVSGGGYFYTITYHTYSTGETLSDIAEKYNTTVSNILSMNSFSNESQLTNGDLIKVPANKR